MIDQKTVVAAPSEHKVDYGCNKFPDSMHLLSQNKAKIQGGVKTGQMVYDLIKKHDQRLNVHRVKAVVDHPRYKET